MNVRSGRFAPSPTGRLHFGSILAAVASYLDARKMQARWVVRIEDLDTPRVVPGAADEMLRTLERLGFEWDGPVVHQSRRLDAYHVAVERLKASGDVYGCRCSRKEAGSGPYRGRCRDALLSEGEIRSWRLRVPDQEICFTDRVQGVFCQNPERESGDFVVLRADGLFAYQLAVVVDDAAQGITDVVRGADLLDSTPRQIWLQRRLGFATPTYLHIPVAVNAGGQKLSKQSQAPACNPGEGTVVLRRALRALGQPEPASMKLGEFWDEAIAGWDAGRIRRGPVTDLNEDRC